MKPSWEIHCKTNISLYSISHIRVSDAIQSVGVRERHRGCEKTEAVLEKTNTTRRFFKVDLVIYILDLLTRMSCSLETPGTSTHPSPPLIHFVSPPFRPRSRLRLINDILSAPPSPPPPPSPALPPAPASSSREVSERVAWGMLIDTLTQGGSRWVVLLFFHSRDFPLSLSLCLVSFSLSLSLPFSLSLSKVLFFKELSVQDKFKSQTETEWCMGL